MDQILKHKIGQMIIAGFPSPYVDAQARRLVEDFEVGNFALFGRNYVTAEQTTQMCRDLHKLVYEKNGCFGLVNIYAVKKSPKSHAATPSMNTVRIFAGGSPCGVKLFTRMVL